MRSGILVSILFISTFVHAGVVTVAPAKGTNLTTTTANTTLTVTTNPTKATPTATATATATATVTPSMNPTPSTGDPYQIPDSVLEWENDDTTVPVFCSAEAPTSAPKAPTFSKVAKTNGAPPKGTEKLPTFVQVWEARDQGWTTEDKSWGTLNQINKLVGDLVTNFGANTGAHEATHVLEAQLSNLRHEAKKAETHATFVPGKGAFYLKPPPAKRRHVVAKIPAALRGSRFQTYVNPEADLVANNIAGGRNANALYLFTEWSGYLNGDVVSIEYHEKKIPLLPADQKVIQQLTGSAEFCIYALGAVMLAKDSVCNGYSDEDYAKLRGAFVYQTDRLTDYLKRARAIEKADSKVDLGGARGQQILDTLRTSSEAAAMRTFLKNEFPADWVKTTFGF